MSGGEAFVILAAADMAVRERRERRRRSTESEWSPFFGSIYKIHKPVASPASAGTELSRGGRLATRSWIETLVAAVAGIIILLMVAVGGIAVERVASAATWEAGPTSGEADPLVLCSTVNEQTTCVREPT